MRLVGPICFQSWNGAKDGVAALEDAGFGVELFLDMVETFSHVTYGAVFIDAAADADENKLWSRIRALIDPHGGLVDEFGLLGPGESLRDLWKNLPPLVKRQ